MTTTKSKSKTFERRWGDRSTIKSGISCGRSTDGREDDDDAAPIPSLPNAEIGDDNEQEWQTVHRHKPKSVGSAAKNRSQYPTLFVKGFPRGWFPLNIERVFGQAGAVMDVVMPRDRSSGIYRGFALVRMSSEVELARAVDMLHGQKFSGCPLLVQRARFGPKVLPSSKPLQTKIYRPKPNTLPPAPFPPPHTASSTSPPPFYLPCTSSSSVGTDLLQASPPQSFDFSYAVHTAYV